MVRFNKYNFFYHKTNIKLRIFSKKPLITQSCLQIKKAPRHCSTGSFKHNIKEKRDLFNSKHLHNAIHYCFANVIGLH